MFKRLACTALVVGALVVPASGASAWKCSRDAGPQQCPWDRVVAPDGCRDTKVGDHDVALCQTEDGWALYVDGQLVAR